MRVCWAGRDLTTVFTYLTFDNYIGQLICDKVSVNLMDSRKSFKVDGTRDKR